MKGGHAEKAPAGHGEGREHLADPLRNDQSDEEGYTRQQSEPGQNLEASLPDDGFPRRAGRSCHICGEGSSQAAHP